MERSAAANMVTFVTARFFPPPPGRDVGTGALPASHAEVTLVK